MNIVLILIGIILIVISYRAINRDKGSFNDILKSQDSRSTDYDVELMAIRRDMAESILDLQKEIVELRMLISEKEDLKENSIKKIQESYDIENDIENQDGIISEINFDNRNSKEEIQSNNIHNRENNKKSNNMILVEDMIKLGHSDEEICKKLNVGKGEVLLVRRLFE